MKLLINIFFFLSLNVMLHAQAELERDNFFGVGISYGFAIPAGDLADRFGQNFNAAISMDFVWPKKKMVLTGEYQYIFGKNVDEIVFQPYLTENNEILGANGGYSTVLLRMRGGYLGASLSKIIPIGHPYSGIKLGLGLGLLQHKIRVQVDTNNLPIFQDEYLKGFDRFSIGPALKQIIGYQRIGTNRSLNYSLQFEIFQGFTNETRPFNFDLQTAPDGRRLDINIALTAKWYLPLGQQGNPEEIYY